MDSLNQFINNTYSYGNTGSSIANGVSAAAQQKQMSFNSQEAEIAYERQMEMANMQAAYNSAAAAEQRAYNEEMWGRQVQANREAMEAQQAFNHAEAILAREFNAAEAEKSRNFSKSEAEALRNWQERMSNTQYQRAVTDMKTAGINPILAAGATAGNLQGAMGSTTSAMSSAATSGLANSSMASSGMASMSQGNIGNASAGNYTGQGNNMSENLAMLGAIASMFGSGMSGLAESIGLFGQSLNLTEFAKELGKMFNPQNEENEKKGWGDGNVTLEDFGLKETGGGMLGILKNIQLALFGSTHGDHESGGGAGHKF